MKLIISLTVLVAVLAGLVLCAIGEWRWASLSFTISTTVLLFEKGARLHAESK